MTDLIVAPRIAEFPTTISFSGPDVLEMGWGSAPLSVIHEWLVHEFGESELAKVKGLPVEVVRPLYPEGEAVAFFSLARETTMLDDLQLVFDAVADSVRLEEPRVLRELQRIQNPFMRIPGVKDYWIASPEVRSLYSDSIWAVRELVGADKNVDTGWLGLFQVATLVFAPLMVKVESRADYVHDLPDWAPVFAALNLDDLWGRVSARIDGWK